MTRTLTSERLIQTYTETVDDFNLTYNVEKENGAVRTLNCNAIKSSGTGSCHFAYMPGATYPNTTFNQIQANPDLQTHVQLSFEEIAAE